MRDIAKRLERLEEVVGALDCICDGTPEVEILTVEEGWDEARIRIAEDAKRVTCPLHGLQSTPILRLYGSDVYG
ncbi:MAG: hypothetical protein WBE91_11750 [Steroidobacteraceae bacterium]